MRLAHLVLFPLILADIDKAVHGSRNAGPGILVGVDGARHLAGTLMRDKAGAQQLICSSDVTLLRRRVEQVRWLESHLRLRSRGSLVAHARLVLNHYRRIVLRLGLGRGRYATIHVGVSFVSAIELLLWQHLGRTIRWRLRTRSVRLSLLHVEILGIL